MRKTETIVVTEATDDITGFVYSGDQSAEVKRYLVTITEVDDNDKPIKGIAPVTCIKDMHDNTYEGMVHFLNGHVMDMLRVILYTVFGFSKAAAIYDNAKGLNDDEFMVTVFGGGKKTPARNKPSDFTPYVRAYAIAQGWLESTKGKLSQDIVTKFITATGITAESFANGARITTETPSE